jgi:predicted transglutaminase-like cysteine proteinase
VRRLSIRLSGRALRILAVPLALLPVLAGVALAGEAQAYPRLFGTRELHSSDLTLFPKWRGALARYHAELSACDAGPCARREGDALIAHARGLDRMSQLQEINRRLNERPYILDSANWGQSDYWATPFQFLRKSGDCEDYAIAKYMALRTLGLPASALRIVVLRDLNLGLAHAVLVVYLDGRAFVLDNQIKTVVPADSIHHYQPVYSVNEEGWWLHRP